MRFHALTVTGAVLAPTVIRLTAQSLGVPFEVSFPGQAAMRIGIPMVIGIALLASLAGWGALAVVRRLTSRARTWWTVLACLALLGSFAPILTASATTGTRAALALMHVSVAAVLIPGFRRTIEK
jgi:hypothetical protein